MIPPKNKKKTIRNLQSKMRKSRKMIEMRKMRGMRGMREVREGREVIGMKEVRGHLGRRFKVSLSTPVGPMEGKSLKGGRQGPEEKGKGEKRRRTGLETEIDREIGTEIGIETGLGIEIGIIGIEKGSIEAEMIGTGRETTKSEIGQGTSTEGARLAQLLNHRFLLQEKAADKAEVRIDKNELYSFQKIKCI